METDQNQQIAKDSIRVASEAAEEFRVDFKNFLNQVITPTTWKDGLKLVMEGGLGFLKDLEEMITKKEWTPDKMVTRLDASLEIIVKKHPELQGQWDDVKVSFKFAKMKTEEALAQLKVDQSKIVEAVWSGVKAEMQKDLSQLGEKLGFKHKSND